MRSSLLQTGKTSCCVASLAAALVWTQLAQGQSNHPSGAPAYQQRPQASTNNPFANAFQKLRSAVASPAPKAQSPTVTPETDEIVIDALGEDFNPDEIYYIEEDGQLKPMKGSALLKQHTQPQHQHQPKQQQRPQQKSSFWKLKKAPVSFKLFGGNDEKQNSSAKHMPQQQIHAQRPNVAHAPAKPLATQAESQMHKTPAPSKEMPVIYVDNINEGTPAIGSVTEVAPSQEILSSLAEGEKIDSMVTVRIVEVKRDGQVVAADELPPAQKTPASAGTTHKVAKPPAVIQEVDPWFGDTIPAPSDAVRKLQKGAKKSEAAPPQSMRMDDPLPALPAAETATGIQQTSYPAADLDPLFVPGMESVASKPSLQPVRNVHPLKKFDASKYNVATIPEETLRKYQVNYDN